MEEKKTFWLQDFEGKAKGGYFIRNNLKEFVEKLKNNNMKLVGIKYDGSYNLECIVEEI